MRPTDNRFELFDSKKLLHLSLRDINNTILFAWSGEIMEFMETEEQSMIREMVRSFAEEVLAPTCLERDRAAKPPLDEWQKFCEYGLQGITIQKNMEVVR
jgi:alkylation response protein AidB-like acyl-CoA dehydrogenase